MHCCYTIHAKNLLLLFRANIVQPLLLIMLMFLSFGQVSWTRSPPYRINSSNDSTTDISPQYFNNKVVYRVCNDGYGIYGVISERDEPSKLGRQWHWQCRKLTQVAQNSSQSCYWSRDVNHYNKDISFTCCENEYIGGVYSYHDNSHEDRRWSFYCCSSSDLKTRDCYTTGYRNSLTTDLDFQAAYGRVITGAISQYDYYGQ